MKEWDFFDYAELNGRNQIRTWLNSLSPGDQAKLDSRILSMSATPRWPEKWVSSYTCREKIYEFRITASVQLRPLGTYNGRRKYIILAGAIEKGGKLAKSDVEKAEERMRMLVQDDRHAVPHEFDNEENMDEDEVEGI